LSVQDIPEWLSLPIGAGFGILITVIVYRLQKRTEKIRDEVIDMIDEVIAKIDSYIQERKKLEEDTKKYYLDKIRKNLDDIKKRDEEALSMITKLKNTGQNPDDATWGWIVIQDSEIKHICDKTEEYVRRLEGNFKNPQINEEMSYLSPLYTPFEHMMNPGFWDRESHINVIEGVLHVHLRTIDNYLDLLSKE
jgi:Rad3-related DNA helicase